MTLSLKLFKNFYYIKQIDSKLPCVCSVIDHIGCQNAVRTSVTHSTAPRVPLLPIILRYIKRKKNEDNSSLKCHLREKIQSVIGCFKSAIFIKTNATIYLPQLLFHLPGCKQLLVSS